MKSMDHRWSGPLSSGRRVRLRLGSFRRPLRFTYLVQT